MSAITIRKLPDNIKRRLRLRAAANGRSMEAEAREILVLAVDSSASEDTSWIVELMQAADEVGGVELRPPDGGAATAAVLTED